MSEGKKTSVIVAVSLVGLLVMYFFGYRDGHNQQAPAPAQPTLAEVVTAFSAVYRAADVQCGSIAPDELTMSPTGEIHFVCNRPQPIAAKVKLPTPSPRVAETAVNPQ